MINKMMKPIPSLHVNSSSSVKLFSVERWKVESTGQKMGGDAVRCLLCQSTLTHISAEIIIAHI